MLSGFWGDQVVCSSAIGQSVEITIEESKDTKAPDDLVTINCVARIERQFDTNFAPHYSADVSGLKLEAAMKYRLKIRVTNPYDVAIQFSRVELTCGCAKFDTKQKEIPPLGTADFEMDLTVLNNIDFSLGRITATFYSVHQDLTPSLKLNVNYTLKGAFGFSNRQAVVELPKDEKIVIAKFPIILVEPVTLEVLELKHSENLRDFNIKIVANDREASTPYIEIEVPRHALPRQGLTGEVGLKRLDSDVVAGVIVSFRHQDTFSLLPESLRLSRDNHSKPYRAFAMLRIADSRRIEDDETDGENTTAASATPQVALAIDGQPASVRIQRMGQSGLYRLTIQHDGPFEVSDDGTVKVRWRVLVNGEERVIESHAFLPDR
jgi:hypothetical protein